MAHAQSVTIHRTYLKHLTLNIYPDVDLKTLYSHTREALTQYSDICVDLPPIQGDRYHGLYDVLAGSRTCCTLQFDPLIATNAPYRLAIKPFVGGSDAHLRIRRILVEIFGLDYELHMNSAKIAEHELAIEVSGTTLDDLFLHDSTKRVSSRHYDEHGRICCLHLGSATSDQQIVITNLKEQKSSQVLIHTPSAALSNGVEIIAKVRVANTPIQDTATIPNPLGSLRIMRLPRTFHGSGSAAWRGFLDSCQLRGMQAALSRLPKPELRNKFRDRVAQQLAVNWWHPASIWSGFPGMISALGLTQEIPVLGSTIPNVPPNRTA